MSLITQCPACNTLFKVVADQLKISQGWVRCGQCREVFDANANMVALAQESVVTDAPPAESQPPNVPKSHKKIAKNQDFDSSDWINSVNPPSPASDLSGFDNPLSLMPEEFDDNNAFSASSASSANAKSKKTAAKSNLASTPSFVRHAQRAQRRRSPGAKAGLSLAFAVLIALGVLQVVRYERDRIAAAQPQTKPWLQELCSYTGCTVEPLKQIDSVVVDASSFNKVRSDAKTNQYKLTVNLKSLNALPVALPHIELTLNDVQDTAILRRVLNPADLGALQFMLAPAGEFAGTASIQIDTAQLAGARISGYRVLAFYP